MTDCTLSRIEFPRCRGRRVVADFDGGDISSNGGALLLALADRRLGLLSGLSRSGAFRASTMCRGLHHVWSGALCP